MRLRTTIILFIVILATIVGGSTYADTTLTGMAAQEVPVERGPEMGILLCQTDDCLSVFLSLLDQAGTVECALFDVDHPEIIEALEGKDARLILDADYSERVAGARYARSGSLMHNKFCLFDDTVWTGSMNPTRRGVEDNDNNVVLLHSHLLARSYREEFEELWRGEFAGGEETAVPKVIYNGALVETRFCPEDRCHEVVLSELAEANESVQVMAFSFTDDEIGSALIERKDMLDIRVIIESRQSGGQYSEYERLLAGGVAVRKDGNPATMHHKVFIIDQDTVITGSYNPTWSGANANDENLLVIHDKDVAEEFLGEFERLWNETSE